MIPPPTNSAAGGATTAGRGAPLPAFPAIDPLCERTRRALARIQAFCVKHALPLGILVGLIWALLWPEPGHAVADVVVGETASNPKGLRLVEFINNCLIFLMSGLLLRTDNFRHLVQHWTAPLFGVVSILLLTPLLALAAKALPLSPPEFAIGLAIFSVVPTTLGSGITLTQVSHGNQALALLLTISTNLLGIITVPFLLDALLTGGGAVITINPSTLAVKLMATALVPSILGMAIRASHPRAREWIKRHKTNLSLFSTFNLVMIVWQTLSAARNALVRQSGVFITLVAVAATLQYLIYLAFNWIATTRVLRTPPAEAVAVVIMASHKTATVAVLVISNITDDVAQQGLFVIPVLLGAHAQIFISSLLAGKFAAWVDCAEEAAAAASAAAARDADAHQDDKGDGRTVTTEEALPQPNSDEEGEKRRLAAASKAAVAAAGSGGGAGRRRVADCGILIDDPPEAVGEKSEK